MQRRMGRRKGHRWCGTAKIFSFGFVCVKRAISTRHNSGSTLRGHGIKSVHGMPNAVPVNAEYRDVGDSLDFTKLFVLVGQLGEEVE